MTFGIKQKTANRRFYTGAADNQQSSINLYSSFVRAEGSLFAQKNLSWTLKQNQHRFIQAEVTQKPHLHKAVIRWASL